MSYTRRIVRLIPSQKPATLSVNLPLLEAFALFAFSKSPRIFSAQFHRCSHLAEYFTDTFGPTVRVHQCQPSKHLAAYAAFRKKQQAHPAVIENEIETLREIWEAAHGRAYNVKKPVAGVKP